MLPLGALHCGDLARQLRQSWVQVGVFQDVQHRGYSDWGIGAEANAAKSVLRHPLQGTLAGWLDLKQKFWSSAPEVP